MARTFKEDDTMIANMFFGVVQLESRLVRDPERSGWAMFENRSVWLGDGRIAPRDRMGAGRPLRPDA